MTPDRYIHLSANFDAKLTADEIAEGWHWCPQGDGRPVGPGCDELRFCECLADPLLERLITELTMTPCLI